MTQFKIVRIDQCDNGRHILRMSLKSRRSIKIETGNPVKVKKAKKTAVAIVEKIGREFIGIRNVCTISSALANLLEVSIDDIVDLSKKVSDKEYKEYENLVLSQREPQTEDEDTNEDSGNDETEG